MKKSQVGTISENECSNILIAQSVRPSELHLVYKGQPTNRYFSDPLFVDGGGKEIYAGDTVEFKKDNEIFPSSGTVQTYNGLKIACFNTLLNKWKYYPIEEE